jgi:hypothetical protein
MSQCDCCVALLAGSYRGAAGPNSAVRVQHRPGRHRRLRLLGPQCCDRVEQGAPPGRDETPQYRDGATVNRRSRPPVFVSGIALAACGHDQPPVRQRALLDSSLRPSCSVSAGNNSGSRLSPRHWLRLAVAVGEHIPTAGVRASTRGRDTAIHVRDVTLVGGDHSRRRTTFLTTECPARSVNATSEGPREAPAAV